LRRNFTYRVNKIFVDINKTSEQVSEGSNQVSYGSQALAQGATEQASTIEELSANSLVHSEIHFFKLGNFSFLCNFEKNSGIIRQIIYF